MQTVNLQITPHGVAPIIHASQFDIGRKIQFYLFDGALAYIPPTGAKIRVDGIKPDKKGFSYPCTFDSNKIIVTLTEQMTAVAGNTLCELRIIDGDNSDIGTLNFILEVEKSPLNDDTDISQTELPDIIKVAKENLDVMLEEARRSEAWAVGNRNGVPVDEKNEAYQNNAKYYADQAKADAQSALTSKNASAQSQSKAAQSATSASTSASAAATSADKADKAAKKVEFYADAATPHFVVANNRLYIKSVTNE